MQTAQRPITKWARVTRKKNNTRSNKTQKKAVKYLKKITYYSLYIIMG
jgi:hypothetical protein